MPLGGRTSSNNRLGASVIPAASDYLDIFDDESAALAGGEHPAYGAIRVPDGRALAWAEYGSPRGMPCILLPDTGSSRLSPAWLLLDSALPTSVRLMALDRPGTGASDPIGLGGRKDAAEDLRRLVETLAVGRVAVIGIGDGADEAFAFAARYPRMAASATGVSVRTSHPVQPRRSRLRRFGERHRGTSPGALGAWTAAAGAGSDLNDVGTWQRALAQLSVEDRTVLGDRWREEDFRAAVAADVFEGGHEWLGIAAPASVPEWITDPGDIQVPVHLWHGRDETPTTLAHIRSLALGRPGWKVSAVAGPTAVMGYWPQILMTAAESFRSASAA